MRNFLVLVFSCILRTVDITSAQFVTRTWFELLADTHPCSHELPVPELQLLDSSSSSSCLIIPSVSISSRLPLSARPQKCLIATRVCTTVWRSGMRWIVFLYLSLFYSGFILPCDERRSETAIGIYMRYIYIRRQTCPLNDKPRAPFLSTAHAPPPFKILLSLVGYSVMIRRMQGRARTGFSCFLRLCEQEG